MHQFRHNPQDLFGLEPGPLHSFNATQQQMLAGMDLDTEFQTTPPSSSLFDENPCSPDPRVFLFSSEQLASQVSTDDTSTSSFTSSTPASPLLGNNLAGFYSLQASTPGSPAFSQFQDFSGGGGCVGSPYSTSIDANSPRTVSEEFQGESPKTGRDYPVVCLHPGCEAKPFKRRADLDRHYKHKHAPASQKDAYYCDYPKCGRRKDPFHRRDHFRDHLREFHKEDIEKRGGSVNEEWLDDRNMSSSWWRCAKCLVRNYVEQSGYDCPLCKTSCQAKRKEIRQRD